jgi:hypothetical protein
MGNLPSTITTPPKASSKTPPKEQCMKEIKNVFPKGYVMDLETTVSGGHVWKNKITEISAAPTWLRNDYKEGYDVLVDLPPNPQSVKLFLSSKQKWKRFYNDRTDLHSQSQAMSEQYESEKDRKFVIPLKELNTYDIIRSIHPVEGNQEKMISMTVGSMHKSIYGKVLNGDRKEAWKNILKEINKSRVVWINHEEDILKINTALKKIKKFKELTAKVGVKAFIPPHIALEGLIEYTADNPIWYAHNGNAFDFPLVEQEYKFYHGCEVLIKQWKGFKTDKINVSWENKTFTKEFESNRPVGGWRYQKKYRERNPCTEAVTTVSGLDTLSLVKKYPPLALGNKETDNFKQETIAKYLGINPNDGQMGKGLAHTSMTDVFVLREILYKLQEKKKGLKFLIENPVPKKKKSVDDLAGVMNKLSVNNKSSLYVPMMTKSEKKAFIQLGFTDMDILVDYHRRNDDKNWLKNFIKEWRVATSYLDNYSK